MDQPNSAITKLILICQKKSVQFWTDFFLSMGMPILPPQKTAAENPPPWLKIITSQISDRRRYFSPRGLHSRHKTALRFVSTVSVLLPRHGHAPPHPKSRGRKSAPVAQNYHFTNFGQTALFFSPWTTLTSQNGLAFCVHGVGFASAAWPRTTPSKKPRKQNRPRGSKLSLHKFRPDGVIFLPVDTKRPCVLCPRCRVCFRGMATHNLHQKAAAENPHTWQKSHTNQS